MGPILCLAGRIEWTTAVLATLICSILSLCNYAYGSKELPRWLCVAECFWLIIFLGEIASNSATCWESSGSEWLIPVALLLLSGFAVYRGETRGARIGATLMWLVIPILSVVLLAGSNMIQPQNISWEVELPDSLFVSVLLLPCLASLRSRYGKEKGRWPIAIIAIMAITASLIIHMTLGREIASQESNGFYILSKSINLFGVAERFEALVACALTGSWFALFVVVVDTVRQLGEKVIPEHSKGCTWFCVGASIGVMCILHIPEQVLGIGNLIFWGFLPILTQVIGGEKKVVKRLK